MLAVLVRRLIGKKQAAAVYRRLLGHQRPHGEHDCGLIEVAGQRVLFKIDYYDPSLCGHSADPADPMVTRRVLTIMLAREY